MVCDVFVAAAACEPVHAGFTAEPGELAFGVVAVALLSLGYSLFAGEFVFEDCDGFGVAERGEGATVCAIANDEAVGLFDEAAVKHGRGALVDALVEAIARRVEPEAQDTVARQSIATFLPLLGQGLLCGKRDLDGANDLGDVVGVDRRCCGWIKPGEDAMQVGRPSS